MKMSTAEVVCFISMRVHGKNFRVAESMLWKEGQRISVSVLPNTEKRRAVIIWKSAASSMALLPTG